MRSVAQATVFYGAILVTRGCYVKASHPKRGDMKKHLALIFILMLVVAPSVFAEDGFKAYLGYSLGSQDTGNSFYADGTLDTKAKSTGLLHGPSVDVRYEGNFFARATFDYTMGSGQKTTITLTGFPSIDTKYSTTMSAWAGELNLGWRLLNTNGFGITPYTGFGYMYNKTKATLPGGTVTATATSPYAALGVLFKYENPEWSAGLDVTGLMPVGGNVKLDVEGLGVGLSDKFKTLIGYGAKVQIPLTYTIAQKKTTGGVGISVFLTPYFQYIDTLKSDKLSNIEALSLQAKYSTTTYGAKAGVGFAF